MGEDESEVDCCEYEREGDGEIRHVPFTHEVPGALELPGVASKTGIC